MKSKLKAVAFCTIAALAGAGIGALDNIQQSRQVNAQLYVTCMSNPLLDACMERLVAYQGIRYSYNGDEIRNGIPVTTLDANK